MYMYLALFRKKENVKKSVQEFDSNHNGVTSIREIGRFPEPQIIKKLKAAISNFPGTWRIYRSVNERDFKKAMIQLQIEMIKGKVLPEKVETRWKSILMSPENKLNRGKWLIDIDDKEQIDNIKEYLKDRALLHETFRTPNGFGITCDPFDSREFIFPDVSIVKDALRFIERIEVKEIV